MNESRLVLGPALKAEDLERMKSELANLPENEREHSLKVLNDALEELSP